MDQYLDWDYAFSDVSLKIETDPVAAQYIFNQIPEEIRVTYPKLESLISAMTSSKDRIQIDEALEKCDEAYDFILHEINEAKALESIENAKRIYPNWDRIPELREKISNTTELQEKLAKGLQIQIEVSALREKGGQTAYQRAMALINEYTSLGLESFGIALFDVVSERENLLKMMTRAEGESWSHRLTSTSASEETLRLEQSIRSLEDAESKNLRVLYNNNARLLNLLSRERKQTEGAIRNRVFNRISGLPNYGEKIRKSKLKSVPRSQNGLQNIAHSLKMDWTPVNWLPRKSISGWQKKPESRRMN